MKSERLLALLLLGMICFSGIVATEKKADDKGDAKDKKGDSKDANGKKKKKKGPKSIQCEHRLLKSYLLHGRHQSKPDPMYLCPTIKNNCCTKMDQQRIYHIAKEFLPQRLLEYQSKIRMALAKLRELHIKINRTRPVFTGIPKRRLYCNAQASQLYNFPFFKMYNEIMEFLDIVRDELNDYYNTFFCQLCDANNHKWFNLKSKQLQMDSEFCKEMVENHQDAMKIFNVDLINYLEALQQVVDCTHYVRSYKLEFFDRSKSKISKGVSKCIGNLGGKDFLKHCRPVCETLKLSKVIETIEGDFEFVIDAVNLFEKFFEFKESGSFISMKLRAFFKRFVVPRSQSRKEVYRFLHDVEHQMRTKKARLKHIKLKMKLSAKKNKLKKGKKKGKSKKAAASKPPVKAASARKLMDVAQKGEGEGLLAMVPNSKDISIEETKEALDKNLMKNLEKEGIKQRVLAAAKPPAKASAKPGAKGKKSKNAKRKLKLKKAKKKYAKLVFNKELFNFYNELHIKKPEPEEKKVFRLRPMPVDVDELKKVFATETGLNPSKYMGNTKFNMDQATLYRLLFNHVNNDKPDVELLMFLNDFTVKYKEQIEKDVDTPFKIQMKKKKKKTARVLEMNNTELK